MFLKEEGILANIFKEDGIQDKVVVGRTEMNMEGAEAIMRGELIAMTDQQIYLQGYLPVAWLYLYKKYGFKPQADIVTGPYFIRKDNAHIVEPSLKGGWRN